MKTSSRKRQPKATRRMDLSDMKQALRDGRQWIEIGVVYKPDGEDEHYVLEMDGGVVADVLVHVAQMPDGLDLTCRLGTHVAGAAGGLWRIPAIGDEVIVALPAGKLDFMPTIVCVLGSRTVPGRVSDKRTILVAPDVVEITAPKVYLGKQPENIDELTDGLVHGLGVDTFTGSTYADLQNTTSGVFAKK